MKATPTFRVMNSIRMLNQQSSSFWMILGQTSAWPNEQVPPEPTGNETSVNQAYCAALATLYWVYADPNNALAPFSYMDAQGNTQRYSSYATQAAAIAGGGTLVLATCNVTGAQITGAGSASFRQVGWASNIVATSGNGALTFLTAAQVQSWGNLEAIDNLPVATLLSNSNYKGKAMFTF